MRRRIVLGVVAALCVTALAMVLTVVSATRPAPRPGVTLETFGRLRLGMSKKEVDRVLGMEGEARPFAGSRLVYMTPGGDYAVVQFEDGRVVFANYLRQESGRPAVEAGRLPALTTIQRLRSWLGW